MVQVALSLPLLTTACLLVSTLSNLRALNTGFAREDVHLAYVDPSSFGYKGQRLREFYDRLCARISTLPGVRSASLDSLAPLSDLVSLRTIEVEGYVWKPNEQPAVLADKVGARYFETLGMPVMQGRDFVEQDNPAVTIDVSEHPGKSMPDPAGSKHVVIVNESFARHFFAAHSPIGKHVATGVSNYEIVGVAKDALFQYAGRYCAHAVLTSLACSRRRTLCVSYSHKG